MLLTLLPIVGTVAFYATVFSLKSRVPVVPCRDGSDNLLRR